MSDELNLKEENRNKGSKPKVWLVGLIIAALVLLWVAPPLAAELYLAGNIDKFIDAETADEISLNTNTFKLLSGRFDEFVVKGHNLSIGNLNVETYELSANEGQVAIFETLRQKSISVKQSPVASMTLNVSAKDMSNLLDSYYESLNEMSVTLHDGYLEVNGVSDTPRGKSIQIAFNALLDSDDWSSLKVTVTDLIAFGDKVLEDDEIYELMEIYSIVIPFDKTNPPIYINSVITTNQRIVITANTSLN